MNARQLAKRAEGELASGCSGHKRDFAPTWHPYYWLGQLHAAEAVMKDDRVRRRNGKSKADRATR